MSLNVRIISNIGFFPFFFLFLGVSDLRVPTFTEASEGEVISLKVVCTLNAELDNKVSDVSCL